MFNDLKGFSNHINSVIQELKVFDFPYRKFDKVVIVGMGGSAIAGSLAKELASFEHNIFLERGYKPTVKIDSKTLVIVSSYSGNTEETLSYFSKILNQTTMIYGICSGGKLLEELKNNNFPLYLLPGGFSPRATLGFTLTLLIKILNEKLLEKFDLDLFNNLTESFPTENSIVYRDALKIFNTFPVIVTEEENFSIGYRFKCQLNENSKMLAYNLSIPEMNHNEIIGWEGDLIDKNFCMVFLIDKLSSYHRNIKRKEITSKILPDNVKQLEIELPSQISSNLLMKYFYWIHYTDWMSYWCGILRNVDIEAVKSIDFLKKQLSS